MSRVLYEDHIARLVKTPSGLVIEERHTNTDAMNVLTETWSAWYWSPTRPTNIFGSDASWYPGEDPRIDWLKKALARVRGVDNQ